MSNHIIESQIEIFSIGSPLEQAEAFRQLVSAKKHNDASKDKRFSAGMERLYESVRSPDTPDYDRLVAVTTLGRISSSIRSLREGAIKRLKSVLLEPLPVTYLLDDVDDRAYVGKVCAATLPEWIVPYSAKAVVAEETGEQVRQAFLEALIKGSSDLDTALKSLSDELVDFMPETEDPAQSMAVKLRRILAAIRGVMADVLPEAGENPGMALARLVKTSFSKVGTPGKQEILLSVGEEIAGVVHEIVRLRFSVATDATTYQAILQIMSLVPTHVWERFAGKSTNLALVANDISEALLILARQGVADMNLATQLTYALGNKNRSQQRRIDLGKRTGIPPDVKTWLIEGRLSVQGKNEPSQSESKLISDDMKIADLLVNSQRFYATESIVREQIFPELEMLTPQAVPELSKLINFGLGLSDAIKALAMSRGLRIRGNPGDEEEYSPLEHELVSGGGGARIIRLLRPAVEQTKSNGVAIVLLKGLAEKVK